MVPVIDANYQAEYKQIWSGLADPMFGTEDVERNHVFFALAIASSGSHRSIVPETA